MTFTISDAAVDAACQAYSNSSLNIDTGMEEDIRKALEASLAIQQDEFEAQARATFEPLIDELIVHAERRYGPLTHGHNARIDAALLRGQA